MWQKIQYQNDLQKFTTGTILVKYPVNGDPVDKLDLTDNRNLLRYEIYAINYGVADLRIPEEDIPNPSTLLGIGHVTGTMDNPPLLHKKISEFITDENWWAQI